MSKLIDLTGHRFGFWVVQSRSSNTKNGHVQWNCTCECGKEKTVTANSLRTGNSTSCGCNHVPDLTDIKFGQLKVLKLDADKCTHNKRYWLCKCKCGNTITVSTHKLREKITTSCGHQVKTIELNNTNAMECFVRVMIPYDKFAKIITKAELVCDPQCGQMVKLLVDLNIDNKILFQYLKIQNVM